MDIAYGFDGRPESFFGEASELLDDALARTPSMMKVTAIGVGDAFGTGGRFHTCWRLDADGHTFCVDFGASSIVGWSRTGRPTTDIDGVVISHLHGDHFGGLPFLLLESQFVSRRSKPLLIAGPPGIKARLETLCEAMFPGSSKIAWSFPLEVREIAPGEPQQLPGFSFLSVEVQHPSARPRRPCASRRAAARSPTPATRPGWRRWSTSPATPTSLSASAIQAPRLFPTTSIGPHCAPTCRVCARAPFW